jgi:hypothetical protein
MLRNGVIPGTPSVVRRRALASGSPGDHEGMAVIALASLIELVRLGYAPSGPLAIPGEKLKVSTVIAHVVGVSPHLAG